MKLPFKDKNFLIPLLSAGIFFSISFYGIILESKDTSKPMQRTSHVLCSTVKENPKDLSFTYNPEDDIEDPEYEYDNNPDFDETQYASDHWDEFLSDPENIDDFPENIFDAQLY